MKVNLDELQGQASAIRDAAQQLLEIQETLLHVHRAINGERATQKLAPAVEGIAGRAADEARDLRLLEAVLEQIADEYAQCERDIRDTAQGDILRRRLYQSGILEIPVIVPEPLILAEAGEPELSWIPWEPSDISN